MAKNKILRHKTVRPKLLSLNNWFLMSLSTIFQLYGGGELLVEETGIPGENHQPAASY
jgi:hypothetical protein